MPFAILLLFLFFQGCVSVPKKEVEEKLAAPFPLSHAEKLALKSGSFEPGDWPSENWWEIFSDPQLNQFITVAIEQSPTMQRALARVEVVRQVAKEKRSILFPHIDLEASSNWQYLSKRGFFRSFAPMIPANVNDIFATLNLTYDLDLFGKNRHQFYAALDLFRAEQAESAETRLLLSAAVAKTYFELQANQERLTIAKNLASRRRALSHLHSMRRSEGVDNEIGVLDADKNLLEIEKLVLGLEEAVTLNANLLRTLMAENPDSNAPLPVIPTSFRGKLPLPQNLSVDLLSRRPDLMAQIWRVEAAAAQIGAARANFFPNINLLAFAGFEALHFNQLFSWESKAGSFYPAFHLPIFTAGKLRANLRAKKAEFDEAIAGYHELLLRASREVVDQLAMIRFLDEQVEVQHLTLDNVKNHAELTFSRYGTGISPYMDALAVEEKLLETQFQMVDLELKKKQASINLMRALGGGYHLVPPLTPSKKRISNG